MQNGIYFNMPEDEYHAQEGLSSTGIKELLSMYNCIKREKELWQTIKKCGLILE